MFKLHTVCRACGLRATGASGIKSEPNQQALIKVANFGVRPLANDFRMADQEHAGFAPLEVMFCPRCKLAQLSVVVDPKILYRDYPYVTSGSATMQRHFEKLMADIIAQYGKLPESILEIGSNDGKFLAFAKQQGVVEVHGIEPDAKLAQTAAENGISTTVKFWPNSIHPFGVKYDIILARHVFAHVDDWLGFVNKAQEFMHKESILWIEAPYALDMIKSNEVDTIYHEHLSYVNLMAVEALLARTKLKLAAVSKYDLHGGCVGLVIRPQEKESVPFGYDESQLTEKAWDTLAQNAIGIGLELGTCVRVLVGQGKTVVGYGASAKSSFWVQQCRFTRKDLKWIADSTKAKWFTQSPGTDIPIVDEGAILRDLPDYAVLFAWNFSSEIIKKNQYYLSKGGHFIIPVPSVKIVPTLEKACNYTQNR